MLSQIALPETSGSQGNPFITILAPVRTTASPVEEFVHDVPFTTIFLIATVTLINMPSSSRGRQMVRATMIV